MRAGRDPKALLPLHGAAVPLALGAKIMWSAPAPRAPAPARVPWTLGSESLVPLHDVYRLILGGKNTVPLTLGSGGQAPTGTTGMRDSTRLAGH